MQKAEDVVAQLQDAIDADQIEEGRLDALKEALKEANEERSTHEGSYGDGVISSDKAKEAMRIAKEEMAEIDVRIEEVATKLKKAEAKASKATVQREKDLQQKTLAINAVSDAKEFLAHSQRRHHEQAAKVSDFIAQASVISSRIPVPQGETAESLDKKLIKLNRDLERGKAKLVFLALPRQNLMFHSLGASAEQIANNVVTAVQLVRAAETQYNSMRELAQVSPQLL